MDDLERMKQLAGMPDHHEHDHPKDDAGEHDHEASMARGQLYHIAKDAINLIKMIDKGDNLEGWVASKITKAKENISVVADYIESERTVNAEQQEK
jgi:hypothetical protein